MITPLCSRHRGMFEDASGRSVWPDERALAHHFWRGDQAPALFLSAAGYPSRRIRTADDLPAICEPADCGECQRLAAAEASLPEYKRRDDDEPNYRHSEPLTESERESAGIGTHWPD